MSDAYADCIVVPVEEIQDGDVIVGCLRKGSENEWNRTWERDGVVAGKGKWTLEYIQGRWHLHKFQVRRAGGGKPGKTIRGDWNGKCHRCGKGTYTGLFKTEHEGGGCRA